MWFTVQNLQDPKRRPGHLLSFCPQWHHGPAVQELQKQKNPRERCQTGDEGKCERWLHGRVTAFLKLWYYLGKICCIDLGCCHLLTRLDLFFSSILNVSYRRTTDSTTHPQLPTTKCTFWFVSSMPTKYLWWKVKLRRKYGKSETRPATWVRAEITTFIIFHTELDGTNIILKWCYIQIHLSIKHSPLL